MEKCLSGYIVLRTSYDRSLRMATQMPELIFLALTLSDPRRMRDAVECALALGENAILTSVADMLVRENPSTHCRIKFPNNVARASNIITLLCLTDPDKISIHNRLETALEFSDEVDVVKFLFSKSDHHQMDSHHYLNLACKMYGVLKLLNI